MVEKRSLLALFLGLVSIVGLFVGRYQLQIENNGAQFLRNTVWKQDEQVKGIVHESTEGVDKEMSIKSSNSSLSSEKLVKVSTTSPTTIQTTKSPTTIQTTKSPTTIQTTKSPTTIQTTTTTVSDSCDSIAIKNKGVCQGFNHRLEYLKKLCRKETTKKEEDIIVMVMSGRANAANRMAIRETWAKYQKDVYFVVGKDYCQVPRTLQSNFHFCKVQEGKTVPEASRKKIVEEEEKISKLLYEEREKYGDVVIVDMIDSYGNLGLKTKLAIKWVVESWPNDEKGMWKIDDDQVLVLDYGRQDIFPSWGNDEPVYGGWFRTNVWAQPKGKWAELKYKSPVNGGIIYPKYADGSVSYFLNGKLMQAFKLGLENDLLDTFRCEDASIAIWIEYLQFKKVLGDVKHKTHKTLFYQGEAKNNWWKREKNPCKRLTYDHREKPEYIRQAYNHFLNLLQ